MIAGEYHAVGGGIIGQRVRLKAVKNCRTVSNQLLDLRCVAFVVIKTDKIEHDTAAQFSAQAANGGK